MRVANLLALASIACGAYAAVAAVPVSKDSVVIEHEVAAEIGLSASLAPAIRAPGGENLATDTCSDSVSAASIVSASRSIDSPPAPYTSLSAFPTVINTETDIPPTPYTSLSAFPTAAIRARSIVEVAETTDTITIMSTTIVLADTAYATPTLPSHTSDQVGNAELSSPHSENDDRTCGVQEKTCFGHGKNTCCSIYGYCGSGPEYCLPATCNPFWGYCGGHHEPFEGAQYLIWNLSLKAGLAQIHQELTQKLSSFSIDEKVDQDINPQNQGPIRRAASLERRAYTTLVNVVTEASTVTAPAAATTTILTTGTPPPTNASASAIPLPSNSTQPDLHQNAVQTSSASAETSSGVPVGVMVVETTAVVTVGPSPTSSTSSETGRAFTLTDPINTNITTVVHGTSASRVNNTAVDTASYINISTFSMSGQSITAIVPHQTTSPYPTNSASTTTASVGTATAPPSTTSTNALVGGTSAVTSRLGHHSSDAVEFDVPPVPAVVVLALALCFGIALFL